MEPVYREGTRFDDSFEKVVQIDLHTSNLPSKQEIEARKFRAAVDNAFREVQHVKIENNHEVLSPMDPVELVRVSSILTIQNRQEYLEASLTGEVNSNAVWLDETRNRKATGQVRNNVVSFDDARARYANTGFKDVA